MFSRTIAIIFVANFIFGANGFVINAKLRVLEPVLECSKAGNDAGIAFEKTLGARRDTDADDLKWMCISNEEYASCLAAVIKGTPSPVPRAFLFYGAVVYQSSVLMKRASLCPELQYGDLENVITNSGIMAEENFSDIGKDPYEECAGDAMKKCLIADVELFEHEGDPDAEDDAYIRCMEGKAKSCKYPIMQHVLDQLKAYKKHVKQLLELAEKEG